MEDEDNTTSAENSILSIIDKQWSQAQQSEGQRATVTNFLLIIAAGLQGFVVQRRFDHAALGVALVLIFLGVYGAVISAKYYERFRMSMCRVGKMIDTLEKINPNVAIWTAQERADELHASRYPVLVRLRLHVLWCILHIAIAILGAVDSLVIVLLWWEP